MKATSYDIEMMNSLLQQIKTATAQLEAMLRDVEIEGPSTEVLSFCLVSIKGSKALNYQVPEGMELHVGDNVHIPFGKNDIIRTGVVLSVGEYLRENSPWPPEKTKFVYDIV